MLRHATGTPVTGVQDLNSSSATRRRSTGRPGSSGRRDRPGLPTSTRTPAGSSSSSPHSTSTRRRRLHRQEHDRPRRVSNTGDPTGPWTIYHVPAQNDGTDGTPDHGCTLDGTMPGPCFQDYPHIGADPTASTSRPTSTTCSGRASTPPRSSRSRRRSWRRTRRIDVTLVENLAVDGSPGSRCGRPRRPPGSTRRERNGTEYFLSTIAGDGCETGNPTGTASRIGIWALTNTASLEHGHAGARASPAGWSTARPTCSRPRPTRSRATSRSASASTTPPLPTPFGPGCWQLLFVDEPAHDEVDSRPDSLDTRMQQTWYAERHAVGLARTPPSASAASSRPASPGSSSARRSTVRARSRASVKKQGYLALANNNLTYPAIAMTPTARVRSPSRSGRGPLPERGLRPHRRRRHGRADPRRRRRARAGRRVHQLQGVRRRPAADPLGRLRRRRDRRQLDLDRVGVHRPDLHAAAVFPARRARPASAAAAAPAPRSPTGTRG